MTSKPKASGTFPRYPGNEDVIVTLDQLTPAIYNLSLIASISHCWLRGLSGAEGWDGRPHPDNAICTPGEKYAVYIEGLQMIKQQLASGMDRCYVWLDFGCID